MKRTLLAFSLCLLAGTASRAQITINVADMPALNDRLSYSSAMPSAGLNLSNTGANIAWDYSTLVPVSQGIDTYKTASAAGYSGIGAGAYGYLVDTGLSFSGAPVTLNDVYTFFSVKTTPSRFVAEGFGGKVNRVLNVSAPYSDEDEWYFLPLTFGKYDSSSFKLNASVLGLGTLKMQGSRKTTVDGWGTIVTPHFTTPTQVLRVRSEVDEIDTITYLAMNFPVPRHFVDYKWLAAGEHYPALWVTTTIVGSTETPTRVRYRDNQRSLGVAHTPQVTALTVFPNPAVTEINVSVPAAWTAYRLHIYDVAGKRLAEAANTTKVNVAALPSGRYTIIAECAGSFAAAQFVK